MTSKVMELASDWVHEAADFGHLETSSRRDTFLAEVTRMEQELAMAKAASEAKGEIARQALDKLAALEAQEPVTAQYQDRDGKWCDFINEKHRADTIKDGTWPIRTLYLAAGAKEPVAYRLSDADITDAAERCDATDPDDSYWKEFARVIEARIFGEVE